MALYAASHAVSASAAGVVSTLALYPLENLRLRLQVGGPSRASSVAEVVRSTLEREGVAGLYQGVRPYAVGVGVSNLVFFFWLALLKKGYARYSGSRRLTPGPNLVLAAAAGALNTVVTVPLWVVATRAAVRDGKAPPPSVAEALRAIVREEGVRGLFAGLVPGLVLVANPVVQFVAFEQLVRAVAARRRLRAGVPAGPPAALLSAGELFALGAAAKALATVVTYPYQVIKARMQAGVGGGAYATTTSAAKHIWATEGAAGFARGLPPKLVSTCLNAALMFVLYDRISDATLRAVRFAVSSGPPPAKGIRLAS